VPLQSQEQGTSAGTYFGSAPARHMLSLTTIITEDCY